MESDEEIRRVPEIGGEPGGTSASGRELVSTGGPDRVQQLGEGQRKRGRSPADKENKRLKRLLRNRVSAQQARERKKAYLNELETRVKDLERKNSELDERLSTLQNENQMLRHVRSVILCKGFLGISFGYFFLFFFFTVGYPLILPWKFDTLHEKIKYPVYLDYAVVEVRYGKKKRE